MSPVDRGTGPSPRSTRDPSRGRLTVVPFSKKPNEVEKTTRKLEEKVEESDLFKTVCTIHATQVSRRLTTGTTLFRPDPFDRPMSEDWTRQTMPSGVGVHR